MFFRDVLGRMSASMRCGFRTYDGTTTHRIDLTGCGRTALQEHLQKIHDTEEAKRTPTPMRCRLPSIRSTGRSISTARNECCCLPELAGSTAIDGTA